MLKFKYHYLTNTLSCQEEFSPTWQLIDQKFTGQFNTQGFTLQSSEKIKGNWISFQVYENQIRVFYKKVEEPLEDIWSPQKITYYRRYLPKNEEITFTFESSDEVEKVNDKWVKKGGLHD